MRQVRAFSAFGAVSVCTTKMVVLHLEPDHQHIINLLVPFHPLYKEFAKHFALLFHGHFAVFLEERLQSCYLQFFAARAAELIRDAVAEKV